MQNEKDLDWELRAPLPVSVYESVDFRISQTSKKPSLRKSCGFNKGGFSIFNKAINIKYRKMNLLETGEYRFLHIHMQEHLRYDRERAGGRWAG